MTNENRKFSVASRNRKMSVFAGMSNTPTTPKRTKSSSDLKVELSEYQLNGGRRNSTFFTGPNGPSGGDTADPEQLDYKEQFRSTILRMYAENEQSKQQQQPQRNAYSRTKQRETIIEKEQNKMYLLIRYMATEHETLLQFLIFLPLVLTALYIALIEKQPLVK